MTRIPEKETEVDHRGGDERGDYVEECHGSSVALFG
jgi:hypothetical protein